MSNEQQSNLFEAATRRKLRFESTRGNLSVEDLWDLPLTSRDGCDLDSAAKSVNRALKAAGEESFVNTRANPQQRILELKLDIVKHIIAVKIAEDQEKEAAAGRRAERERLVAILESKQEEKMQGMTERQIRARIAELDTKL